MQLSVVIPIYNEAENIHQLCAELTDVLSGLDRTYEVILVDDGSVDGSFEIIRELTTRSQEIKAVRMRRNFGQTAAMAAGFDRAKGQVIVPMDGDMQNDPADIKALLDKIDEGFDVVSGWRRKRRDKWLTRRLPSQIANYIISSMTGVVLRDYGCTLKAYRREVLNQVNLYGEMHRFMPALASQVGAKVAEITVNHRPRERGQSKYGLDRTFRVILDLMTVKFLLKYSTRPMQLFGKWGFVSLSVSGMAGLMTLYMKIIEDFSMNRNPLLVLTAFLFFAGVNFFALGLLAELVTRTYYETQGKPIYSVRETLNL